MQNIFKDRFVTDGLRAYYQCKGAITLNLG